MNLSSLPKIDTDEVNVEAMGDDDSLLLRFSGNADTRVKEEIRSFLLETHRVAQETQVSKVSVDLRELEFMNSACFKAFVTWLAQVRNLEPDKQYRIHFLSNDKIHWQRRSLRALSCFAAKVVRIEN